MGLSDPLTRAMDHHMSRRWNMKLDIAWPGRGRAPYAGILRNLSVVCKDDHLAGVAERQNPYQVASQREEACAFGADSMRWQTSAGSSGSVLRQRLGRAPAFCTRQAATGSHRQCDRHWKTSPQSARLQDLPREGANTTKKNAVSNWHQQESLFMRACRLVDGMPTVN